MTHIESGDLPPRVDNDPVPVATFRPFERGFRVESGIGLVRRRYAPVHVSGVIEGLQLEPVLVWDQPVTPDASSPWVFSVVGDKKASRRAGHIQQLHQMPDLRTATELDAVDIPTIPYVEAVKSLELEIEDPIRGKVRARAANFPLLSRGSAIFGQFFDDRGNEVPLGFHPDNPRIRDVEGMFFVVSNPLTEDDRGIIDQMRKYQESIDLWRTQQRLPPRTFS